MMILRLIRLFVPVFFFVSLMVSHAQWASDPALNNAICRAANDQISPRIISDGRDGAIICWSDSRSRQNYFDIYVQRIDKDGFVRWTVNGVAINTTLTSGKPKIVSDGVGGAIIVWIDSRNGNNDIYAQRIDSSGNVRWAENGVSVATGPTNQGELNLVSDGRNGAIVTYTDATTGFPPTSRIYAQRIDANGALRWGTGTLVSGTLLFSNAPSIASDGSGGAYIGYAYFPRPDYDVYVQRIDSAGAVKWAARGIAIATGSSTQDSPLLVPDGSGNVFLGYLDWGTGTTPVLHFVVLKRDGTIAKTLRVTSTSGDQTNHRLANIGTGLLGIVWEDGRTSGKKRSYAQIIDTLGNKSWTADGVEVSNRAGDQVHPVIISDGSNGVIVAWEDKTSGSSKNDIYAQRISGSGSLLWSDAGVPVTVASNLQSDPWIISDGRNGAILTWDDFRISPTNGEIYVSRILADGTFPIGPPVLTLSSKTVEFGGVDLGTSSTKNITLTNIGGIPLTISSVTSSDPQFSLTPESNTIAPSGNVTAAVKYQPTSKTTANAYIVIQSNSFFAPDTVSVTGWGTGTAAIQTDKSSLNFGNVNIGSSKSLAIKISNPGSDTLTISSITTTNQRFTVTITSRVLPPGASFDDTVRFSPSTPGPVSANLTITSNAPTSPTIVSLSGSGTAQAIMTLDNATISFGDVAMGTSKDTTVTITNTGGDTLRISSFTSGNPFFTLETAITTIPPAGKKTFTLRFTPGAAGPVSTAFTLMSNAVSSPDTINVSGNGVPNNPVISVAPAQLSFGSVEISRKKDLVLTINNTGSAKLTVTAINSTNADFSALVRQFEVPGNGSFDDTIRFIPSALGNRNGILTILSNAGSSPDTVFVDGIGKDLSAVHRLLVFPGAFTLFQNFPNPFNSSTTIRYDLETSARVSLTVVNTLGQVVAHLVDETQHPGVHTVRWTPAGNTPGVYFYIIRVGVYEAFGTMVLMK